MPINIEPDLEASLDGNELAHWIGRLPFHPGESAIIRPNVETNQAALAAQHAALTLLSAQHQHVEFTVTDVFISKTGTLLSIAGVDGRWPMECFDDPRPMTHKLGVLLMVDDLPFIVEVDNDGRIVDAEPVALDHSGPLDRFVRHQVGWNVAADGHASVGEYVITPAQSGKVFALIGVPWISEASPDELAEAETLVRRNLGRPTASPSL